MKGFFSSPSHTNAYEIVRFSTLIHVALFYKTSNCFETA